MSGAYAGARVLVTGARGFLGSHVAERLAELGARTYAVARSAPEEGSRPRAGQELAWRSGDLCDPEVVRAIVREARPDVVFHLAGRTGAGADLSLVVPTFRDNLASTVTLLSELGRAGCARVVTTGSLEEPSADDPVPASPYAASKWPAAAYARMLHRLHDLPVVIVRPYMTYGPRQSPSKLVPSVALALLRGEAPAVSEPDRRADWIHVDDVTEGILAAGVAHGVEGRTFDLGSGELTSIREVVEELRRIVPGAPPIRVAPSSRPSTVDGRRADIEPARALLGFCPRVPLSEGLARTLACYRGDAS